MSNEKMKILKMLEEKKITASEAAKLLESVDAGGVAPQQHQPQSRPDDRFSAPPPPPPRPSPPPSRDYGSQRAPSSPRGFEDLTGDLGKKFESFARDMEPKLQKFTETVAEKIVSGADRISRGFGSETAPAAPAGGQRGASHSPSVGVKPAASSGFEKNIEMVIDSGYNELSIAGLNGDVRVKGYNGDKITARISYKPKRSGAAIDLMKLGGKYFLKYEEDDFDRVSVDAFVPERMFQVINIGSNGGNMDISSLSAKEMQLANSSGQTRLASLSAEKVKADCSNGRLTLSGIAADSAIIENFNGNVDADELDVSKLSLINYNGGLSLLMPAFTRHAEYIWSVETSNAKLNINVPTLPDLGYHIKAHTTLGDIRVGLTGLQFLINDPALVEARSVNYDRAAVKVKLAVETSNAPLLIN